MRYLFRYAALILLIGSCHQSSQKRINDLPKLFEEPVIVPLNTKEGYAVNQLTGDSIKPLMNRVGDTIKTGIHIPASEKVIGLAGLSNPVIKKTEPPGVIPYNTNNFPVPENLTVIKVDSSKLKKVELGHGDSAFVLTNSKGIVLPTNVPIKIKGKIVPCIQPEPVKALPPRFKENASNNLQHLSMEQGLGYDFINSANEDRDGNLWFPTGGNGVCKYDGVHFTKYTTKEGLSSDVVWSVKTDSKGNLWFGTSGGGLCKYDGHNFIHFTETEGLASNVSWGIHEDHEGNYWITTQFSGISKLEVSEDGVSGTITHYTVKEGLPSNSVSWVFEDSKKNLWFGTSGGAVKFDGKYLTLLTQENGLTDNWVRRILEDKKGNFWFSTFDGLNKYDGKSITQFTQKDGLYNNNVWGLKEHQNGNIWIGTGSIGNLNEGSITKYDGNNFTLFTEKDGFTKSSIIDIYEDRAGNLWFCTYSDGAFRFRQNSFVNLTEKEGLSALNLYGSLTTDPDGNFWLSQGGVLNKFDGKNFYHFFKNNELGRINTIECDKSGNIWLGTQGNGIYMYDGKSLIHYTTQHGLLSNFVFAIMFDKEGNLWIGHTNPAQYQAGITIYRPEKNGQERKFIHVTDREGFLLNTVRKIFEDSRGNIWFGSDDEGLCKYEKPGDDRSGFFTYYSEREGLSSNSVNSMVEDENGDIWFVNGFGKTGVTKFEYAKNGNPDRFLHYTTQQGLLDNRVFSVVNDKNNNLWFGSINGLNLFLSKKDTTGKSRGTNYSIRTYKFLNGVKGLEFDHGAVNNKNQLWWKASNGVTTVDADKLIFNNNTPVIQLNRIKIKSRVYDYNNFPDSNRKKIKFDSVAVFHNYPVHLKLPYNLNQLTFEFSAIDWNAPHQIRYSYRLSGQDNEWSTPSEETSVEYRNLSHDNYTFEVRAIGQSGIWGEPFRYSFVISPPWWLTWWAYLLYAIIAFSLVSAYIRWRQRKLMRDKKMLEEQVSLRTSELHQSMENLKSAQTQLIHSEKMASLGELTAGIAHEIRNPMNFVNNFSEVNKELVDELEQEANKGNLEEVKMIAKDIKDNEEKINYHGKRAEAIVKGMLQHSRTSSGQKEPTDINALCDEYLRLAYHGLRAKDKSFNAKFETDFDQSLPKINVVSQDIGRVVLNLINNAFYAVSEKAKQNISGYEPTVIVKTSKIPPSGSGGAEINIKDNGNGIPDAIKEKIFQPFFTTKPTGQGTGLGLSLSYDIVRTHGGEIKLETKEGEGSVFIIKLPAN